MARDLAAAEREIATHLGLELCYRDPGVATFGLHNALFPIGDKLLEVVSPTQNGTTAGRLLDKRGGDGGYMVIFEVDDVEATRQRMVDAGVRIVFEAALGDLERDGITGLHLHPRDVGGAIVSIDQAHAWGEWPWAGPSWRHHVRTDIVSDIAAVEVQAGDPAAMASRWGEVLGRPSRNDAVVLDEGTIRFVPVADTRGEGVSAVELVGSDVGNERTICGCVIRIVAAG